MSTNVRVFSLTFAAVLIVGVAYNWITHKPFVHPHIKTSAYIAPPGCPLISREVRYNPKEIPCACAAKQYEFADAEKYGFVYLTRRNHKFYRIGNDAVEIEKAGKLFLVGRELCFPGNYVTNIFYQ